jgi:hypothetical protein
VLSLNLLITSENVRGSWQYARMRRRIKLAAAPRHSETFFRTVRRRVPPLRQDFVVPLNRGG